MESGRATELILIRHAPALTNGRLCGRTDVPAGVIDDDRASAVRRAAGIPARLIASPALRCRQTAVSLWPELTADLNEGLWEQDFGDWEGLAYADLPDLGTLPAGDLSRQRPPHGESFDDLCARTALALRNVAEEGGATIVAHAGTVRAALALALGSAPPALAFEVAPLSLTRLTRLSGGGWSIGAVNWTPA